MPTSSYRVPRAHTFPERERQAKFPASAIKNTHTEPVARTPQRPPPLASLSTTTTNVAHEQTCAQGQLIPLSSDPAHKIYYGPSTQTVGVNIDPAATTRHAARETLLFMLYLVPGSSSSRSSNSGSIVTVWRSAVAVCIIQNEVNNYILIIRLCAFAREAAISGWAAAAAEK